MWKKQEMRGISLINCGLTQPEGAKGPALRHGVCGAKAPLPTRGY